MSFAYRVEDMDPYLLSRSSGMFWFCHVALYKGLVIRREWDENREWEGGDETKWDNDSASATGIENGFRCSLMITTTNFAELYRKWPLNDLDPISVRVSRVVDLQRNTATEVIALKRQDEIWKTTVGKRFNVLHSTSIHCYKIYNSRILNSRCSVKIFRDFNYKVKELFNTRLKQISSIASFFQ